MKLRIPNLSLGANFVKHWLSQEINLLSCPRHFFVQTFTLWQKTFLFWIIKTYHLGNTDQCLLGANIWQNCLYDFSSSPRSHRQSKNRQLNIRLLRKSHNYGFPGQRIHTMVTKVTCLSSSRGISTSLGNARRG